MLWRHSLRFILLVSVIFSLSRYTFKNYRIQVSSTLLGCLVMWYIIRPRIRPPIRNVFIRNKGSGSLDKNESYAVKGVLTGVLIDVSLSMKEALTLDKTLSGSVERTHAIATTLNGIVKKEIGAHHDHERCDCIFVSAFGLKDVNTCDLVQLLKYQEMYTGSTDTIELKDLNFQGRPVYYSGHYNLIALAKARNASHVERWIQRCLTEAEAGVLYTVLSRDQKLTEEFIKKLPEKSSTISVLNATSGISGGLVDVPDSILQDSEAYKLAKKIIYHFADTTIFLKTPEVQIPKIWPVKEVSDLLDKVLKRTHTSKSQETFQHPKRGLLQSIRNNFLMTYIPLIVNYFHSRLLGRRHVSSSSEPPQRIQSTSSHESLQVTDLFDHLTPYIYGFTPMVESLNHAKTIFYQNQNKADDKILFILSDGCATDGNPLPVAEQLHAAGVTVVTCFLTDKEIQNPKRMIDPHDDSYFVPLTPWNLKFGHIKICLK